MNQEAPYMNEKKHCNDFGRGITQEKVLIVDADEVIPYTADQTLKGSQLS